MLTLLFCYAALCDPHFDRREAATARLAHLIDRHPALYGPRLGDWCRGAHRKTVMIALRGLLVE
jgi:hypothetical protein